MLAKENGPAPSRSKGRNFIDLPPGPVALLMRETARGGVRAVALANKNARIAWSLFTSDSVYDARLSVRAA
jgi:hypothetical protein